MTGRGQDIGRVDVSEPASISFGIAQRYASAVFDLALETKSLDSVEKDVDALAAVLAESDELRELINNPVYSREEQGAAIVAVATQMGVSDITKNTLALMASKRRLFAMPQLIVALREKIAAFKGEVTAEVVSATALTDAQKDKLAAALKESVGKDVKIEAAVDETLIGGLVVKVGSKMVDTSIRSKLNALQNAMKEVG
nr:F0F1 ATP synthase subunit delta [Donghicola mangrovi]